MGDTCEICMGMGKLLVGLSFPPKKTIAVCYEYDPCPACQPPPHTFHARRTMQIIAETKERRLRKEAALTAAEIRDFRFHDLRHTFATRLLRQTGNLKLVSRLLGHTQIETTMRYAHVIDADLRAALDGYAVTSRVPNKSAQKRGKNGK